jgi:uncharacterized phage protein (TIGR02218 family)
MSVDAYEQSAYDGKPGQLFRFDVGSTIYGYTNAPKPYTHLGVEYRPLVIRMDDIRQSLAEGSPTIGVTLDSASEVAQAFVPYMPHEPIKLRVFRYHRGDDEYATELIAEVTNASLNEDNDETALTVRMIASNMDRKVPWPSFQRTCNNVLYGPQCRVNPDLYRVETTLTGAAGVLVSSADFEVGDPTFFVAGWVRNLRTNERRWVVRQDGPVLTLQTPFIDARGGDPIEALAGCDLLKTTCETKFNNLHRYWGFGDVPTKNPFRDNIFGTGTHGGTPVKKVQLTKGRPPEGVPRA